MPNRDAEFAVVRNGKPGSYTYHSAPVWELYMGIHTGAPPKDVILVFGDHPQQPLKSIDVLFGKSTGTTLREMRGKLEDAGYNVEAGRTDDRLIQKCIKSMVFPARID